ncbi:hypothetical protein C8A00DRAFT_34372 [Chaetomidium leptoderma]|uniref:Uncharacterized protein n=1 Tax=Chaetomidium leptoderma TaxID=669021 RepID=A0AAN6ZVY9_9PEZI|nr:hypothetical protein C8A00DRAFT_34372 [Chaetomidium leptoderma]
MADMADPAPTVDQLPSSTAIQQESSERPLTQVQRIAAICAMDLTDNNRADSPTDAILPMIRRAPAGPSETSSPAQLDTASLEHGPAPGSNITLPTIHQAVGPTPPLPGPSTQGARPETALPAPIFPATPQYNPAGGPSYRLDQALINSAVPRLFPTLAILMDEINISAPRACKFMHDCVITRGLPQEEVNWRKSMSHIFGRNKNCTRSIPEHVWMWMCRKHYQRGRYRNTSDYAKKIARLIEVQVLRIEVWSNHNIDMGVPQNGVVRDWSLVVRRREQQRIDEDEQRRKLPAEAGSNEDPSQDADDGDGDGDGDADSDSPASPTTTGSSVVPQWLLDEREAGKTTQQIQAILVRICTDVDNGVIENFPDIEILPNIVGEKAKPKTTRAKARNQPARKKALPAPSLPHRDKRARPNNDNEHGHDAGNHAGRFPYPSHHLPAPRLNNERYGAHANVPSGWPARYPNAPHGGFSDGRAKNPHLRAQSLDVNHFNQQPMAFQAPYPEPPNGYSDFQPPQTNGYNPAPPHPRDFMRPDNGFPAPQLAQNPHYFHPGGFEGHQQQQQPASSYVQDNYYAQPATAAGAPQGGLPPIGVAKHSRHQSTPNAVGRTPDRMQPQFEPTATYLQEPQYPNQLPAPMHNQLPAPMHSQAAPVHHQAAAVHHQAAPHYQYPGSLTHSHLSDNLPRHGGPPAVEGYENYPPSRR